MSKVKLRLKRIFQCKNYVGTKNREHTRYSIWEKGTPHLLTNFDNDVEDIYLEAIKRYNTYPFKTHEVWIEKVNENTSSLMVKHYPYSIPDMGPFWGMYFTEKFARGKTEHRHYDFDSMDEAYEYYYNNYNYAEYPTPREKYLKYRKEKSDKTSFEWQLKKEVLKNSKLNKKHLARR